MKTCVFQQLKTKKLGHETIRESLYDVSENYKETNL